MQNSNTIWWYFNVKRAYCLVQANVKITYKYDFGLNHICFYSYHFRTALILFHDKWEIQITVREMNSFVYVSNKIYLRSFNADVVWFLRQLKAGINIRSFRIDDSSVHVCGGRCSSGLGLLLLNAFTMIRSVKKMSQSKINDFVAFI